MPYELKINKILGPSRRRPQRLFFISFFIIRVHCTVCIKIRHQHLEESVFYLYYALYAHAKYFFYYHRSAVVYRRSCCTPSAKTCNYVIPIQNHCYRDIPHVVYIKYYVATTCGGCPMYLICRKNQVFGSLPRQHPPPTLFGYIIVSTVILWL